MIPYYPQPVAHVGHWAITAFGVTALLALAVGRWVLGWRARRLGIQRDSIVPLYILLLAAAIAGASCVALFRNETGFASIGACAGALAGSMIFCRWRRYNWERSLDLLDALAFAGVFAAAVGRVGCSLAHEHRGVFSNSPLAVRFPEGSRYDLGLIDLLFLAGLCAAFVWLDRRRRPAGFFLLTGMIAYSGFRVLRGELEIAPQVAGWTAILIAGLLAAALLWRWTSAPAPMRPAAPEPVAAQGTLLSHG